MVETSVSAAVFEDNMAEAARDWLALIEIVQTIGTQLQRYGTVIIDAISELSAQALEPDLPRDKQSLVLCWCGHPRVLHEWTQEGHGDRATNGQCGQDDCDCVMFTSTKILGH